ncbi:tryptophanyl-tRNA synthetase [Aulographum hederae CBS 113979]|uniref:Tryptophan--tRNA ligase, mitochondrial n=1 Tax=Aulographum hederae CBS 113979 TaxID=1176131 RepID=A0A6G1GLE8_9PEZI|nr:tryptophanyl-tRNA synthetase [Aulographum hederae CBS 113979]
MFPLLRGTAAKGTATCLRSIHIRNASSQAASKGRVVFSGIQPTGVPHLGNYLGALRQWRKLQDEAAPEDTLLYSIVDLHAITIRQDPAQLKRWKKEMLATMLAIGLDPHRSIIFYQSSVPAHSELMWILSCSASMGYLSRMTQWKSKMSLPDDASPLDTSSKAALKLGLFSYPVLQGADILVHSATHVPVGHDQSQHLEFARELSNGFNHIYGPILSQPTTILSPAKRIMSLKEPTLKMSKSHADPKSRILLTDSRDEISKKIKTALTDSITGVSYDPETRPGVSNLVEIVYHLNDGAAPSCEAIAKDCQDLSIKAFKEMVADCIDAKLSGIRERYYEILNEEGGSGLRRVADMGGMNAAASAEATMEKVRDAVGL